MPPLSPAHPIREAIRKNVGRLAGPVTLFPGLPVEGRYGTVFSNGELIGGSPAGGAVEGTLPPTAAPTVATGHTLHLAMSVPNATREIAVTGPLPYPTILRQVAVLGNNAAGEAISFRLLLADDNDTTATAEPTGSDIIEFGGDLVGAEDPGAHAILGVAPLVFEPWKRILGANQRLKLKVHNVAGGARLVFAYFDLDDLTV